MSGRTRACALSHNMSHPRNKTPRPEFAAVDLSKPDKGHSQMDSKIPVGDQNPSRLIEQARDQMAQLEKLVASTSEAARRSRALLDELERRHAPSSYDDREGLRGRLA
jgi:hypothetical protein